MPLALARGLLLGALTGAASELIGLSDLLGTTGAAVVLLGAALGAALAALRAERVLWLGGGLLVAVMFVVATTPVARPLVESRVRRDPVGADVDAVVVLSAALTSEGRVTGQGLERLVSGLRLARQLGRPLVVSVVRSARHPEISSLADQRALAALAGLDSALVTVDDVWSTRDEAERVRAEAARRGWRRVAVVTSPTHSRRTCATFEKVGLAVRCVPADPRDLSLGGPFPMAGGDERLRGFGRWLYEVLGTALYRARGWI